MIDWTKPVRTKDGEPVEILTTKGRGDYPVIGYLPDDRDDFTMWTIDGNLNLGKTSKYDLENIPELEAPIEIKRAFEEGFKTGVMSHGTGMSLNNFWDLSKAKRGNLGKKVV